MSVPRYPSWRYFAMAPLIVLPILLLGYEKLRSRPGPQFHNVQQLKAWAESREFYCRSDWEDGRVTSSLAVSIRPLTWEQVGRLCVGRHRQGPQWEGIIWAIDRQTNLDVAPVPPWDGECRDWGGIQVTGDPRLLDRIEHEER
jgi:hypothetical protein